MKPVLSGGSTGHTSYTTIDVDKDSNIAIGGSSSDSSLVSSFNTPNAFMILVMSGGAVKWTISFNDLYDDITAIQFEATSVYLIAVFDSSVTK